jgi:ankyrin repeat protein
MMGHLKYVTYLTRAKGDVKLKDGKGRTCLHVACEMGHKDVIQLLVSDEVHASDEKHCKELCLTQTPDGETCAYLAAQMGHTEALKQLWEKWDNELFSIKDKHGASCWHAAARGGHLETLEWLVGKDTRDHKELLTQTTNGASCLHIAASNGHVKVVTYLLTLEGKKLMGMTVKDGSTCAHIASRNGHLEVLKTLEKQPGGEELILKENSNRRSCLAIAKQEMRAREAHSSELHRESSLPSPASSKGSVSTPTKKNSLPPLPGTPNSGKKHSGYGTGAPLGEVPGTEGLRKVITWLSQRMQQ